LFGPLAFGGVEPWSIFILETGAALLFALWAIQQARSNEIRISVSPLFPPMLAFAALVVVQVVAGSTAYRYQTIHSARLYLAYGLLSFLAVQCLRRKSQLATLAAMVCVYGFCLAAFAMFYGFSSNGKLYWLRTPRFGGWIYGPYVNHNHYAGLMEMLVPIPLVLSLTRFAHGPRKTLIGVASALMATTIFLSGSRGGMIAFGVQMAVLAALLIRQKKGRNVALAAGVFLILGAVLVTWLGGNELANRLASIGTETRTELERGTRLQIDRDGLKMALDKPVLGWGLGTFADVYPQYRTFYTNFLVNEAHNDYLQLLVETGGLGFAIMLWFVGIMYYRAARKLQHWTSDPNGALALAAMLGCTGILIHSFVDFNLQIPGNAALFYVLCVLAALKPRFAATHRHKHAHRTPASAEVMVG
jgi:O-antigen ligase